MGSGSLVASDWPPANSPPEQHHTTPHHTTPPPIHASTHPLACAPGTLLAAGLLPPLPHPRPLLPGPPSPVLDLHTCDTPRSTVTRPTSGAARIPFARLLPHPAVLPIPPCSSPPAPLCEPPAERALAPPYGHACFSNSGTWSIRTACYQTQVSHLSSSSFMWTPLSRNPSQQHQMGSWMWVPLAPRPWRLVALLSCP